MRLAIVVTLTMTLSGCSLMGDHLIIAGTPEGIRAFADGQNGLVAQVRTGSKTGQSAYWETRKHQEHETTERSVWSRIWRGGMAKQEEQNDARY